MIPFQFLGWGLQWAASDKLIYFHRKEEKMSIKELLVTFVTSEEASITQRSFFNVGAVLTVVVLVAMVIVGLTSQPAWAQKCCGEGCCGSPDCSDWSDTSPYCGTELCHYYERSCFSGCVEYYITCWGGCPTCSCPW